MSSDHVANTTFCCQMLRPVCGRVWGSVCCLMTLGILFAGVFLTEILFPPVFLAGMRTMLVHETPLQLDAWCDHLDPEHMNFTMKVVFFNLTNGKELQTVTPAPKPHFEAVEIEFLSMSKSFDCSLLDEENKVIYSTFDKDAASQSAELLGEKIKWHSWSTMVPTNPEDYNKSIVSVNGAYLLMVSLMGGETFFDLMMSTAAVGIVKQYMDGFGGAMVQMNAALNTSDDNASDAMPNTADGIGAMQFGSSAITNVQIAAAMNLSSADVGFTSIASLPTFQAMGVCTPVEIGAYMNDVASGPFAPGGMLANLALAMGFEFVSFSMSIDEAKAFLALHSDGTGAMQLGSPNWAAVLMFSGPSWAAAFGAGDIAMASEHAKMMYNDTDMPGSLFAPTYGTLTVKDLTTNATLTMCSSSEGGDGCPLVALAYVQYLTSYLPEKFFVGCLLHGCADKSCMMDDGTYPKKSGLFQRLTIEQILHGDPEGKMRDPFFPPGARSFGSLGHPKDENFTEYLKRPECVCEKGDQVCPVVTGNQTLWGDQQCINRTAISNVRLSGSSDITRAAEWVEIKGRSEVSIEDTQDSYPGWGNNGTPGAPFHFTGMRPSHAQASRTALTSPFDFTVNERFKAPPNFNASIDFFLSAAHRPVTANCGAPPGAPVADCPWEEIHGAVHVKTFRLPADLTKTKVNGTLNATCGASKPPTCDFLQRHNGVFNMAVMAGGFPLAVTMGWLGLTDNEMRETISMTNPTTGKEIYYNATEDELRWSLEPFTGMAMHAYEGTQVNYYVEKDMFNAARYANIFTRNETFVWPSMYFKADVGLAYWDARAFQKGVYGGFAVLFLGQVFFLVFAWCFCSFTIMCCDYKRWMPDVREVDNSYIAEAEKRLTENVQKKESQEVAPNAA